MKSLFRAVLTGVVIMATLFRRVSGLGDFPGANGRIAFTALPTPDAPGMQIYTIGPNGTGLRQLTHLAATGSASHASASSTRLPQTTPTIGKGPES